MESPEFKIIDDDRILKYRSISFQFSLKKFLWLKKLKTLFHRHLLLAILQIKKLFERFMKNNYKKQIKTSLELKR